ncbi:hypothetical protein AG74_102 [Vibrio phage AG74]|uniref:Uncharacterized protein n=1 Tax=Vibrio phage AG74 TaxID=2736261 RepID=A0A6M9Z2H7_9CAUD|nr:hypothetical protein KNV06_gp189 [Vibrio phage AG74]QKN84954.1 hypothetical protein AG74_102 [Vibrio phage AG74]
MKMIKVIVSDEVVEFDSINDAFDEVDFWAEVTMIDTETNTVYCYNEQGVLEHTEKLSVHKNLFSKEEMEIVKSALEFASNNSEGLTKMVIENIINKI